MDITSATINANVAECLKTAMHFGHSRIHNVCNGTVTDVPWGGADSLLAIGLTGVFVTFALAMVFLVVTMWREF